MDARPRGKIARLPREIRQALNERLLDGEPQSTVLTWLNTHPEVRSRLATDFAGRPITKQNLSEWHAGGYSHWFAHRQFLDSAQQIVENGNDVPTNLSHDLSLLLAARLALAAKKAQATADPASKAKLIFQICRSVARQRRAEHARQRVAIERQKAAAATGDFDEVIQARFWQWMEDPAHREKAYGKQHTPLEKRAEVRRNFGLDPLPADHPDNDDINDPLGPDDIPMSFWQDVLEAEPVPDHVLGLDLIPPLVPPDHQFASELEQREAEAIRCRRVDAVRWAKWMALARRREAGLPTPKLPPPTIKRKIAKTTTTQARNRNCDSSPAKVDPCLTRDLPGEAVSEEGSSAARATSNQARNRDCDISSTKVDPCLPRGASSEARAAASTTPQPANSPETPSKPETPGPQSIPASPESPAKEGSETRTPFPTPYPDIDRLPSVYNCDPNQPLPPTFMIRRCDLDNLIRLDPPTAIPETLAPD